MIRYLETPQLPEGKVRRIALGERYSPGLEPELDRLGIRVLPIPANPSLDVRIASHADLALLHLGGDRFAAAEGLLDDAVIPIYNKVPVDLCDSALNICIVGDWEIRCTKTAWTIPGDKRTPIPVRQRYTRCSVCIADSHSVITADRGIARACEAVGLDVLRITPGFFRLEGFSTGFIGGSSFKAAKDLMVFTGTLRGHPDEERIKSFLHVRGMDIHYLAGGPAADIGSAVLLMEEISV